MVKEGEVAGRGRFGDTVVRAENGELIFLKGFDFPPPSKGQTVYYNETGRNQSGMRVGRRAEPPKMEQSRQYVDDMKIKQDLRGFYEVIFEMQGLGDLLCICKPFGEGLDARVTDFGKEKSRPVKGQIVYLERIGEPKEGRYKARLIKVHDETIRDKVEAKYGKLTRPPTEQKPTGEEQQVTVRPHRERDDFLPERDSFLARGENFSGTLGQLAKRREYQMPLKELEERRALEKRVIEGAQEVDRIYREAEQIAWEKELTELSGSYRQYGKELFHELRFICNICKSEQLEVISQEVHKIATLFYNGLEYTVPVQDAKENLFEVWSMFYGAAIEAGVSERVIISAEKQFIMLEACLERDKLKSKYGKPAVSNPEDREISVIIGGEMDTFLERQEMQTGTTLAQHGKIFGNMADYRQAFDLAISIEDDMSLNAKMRHSNEMSDLFAEFRAWRIYTSWSEKRMNYPDFFSVWGLLYTAAEQIELPRQRLEPIEQKFIDLEACIQVIGK